MVIEKKSQCLIHLPFPKTVILFIGITTIIVKGVAEVGGVSEVWRIAHAGHRIDLDNVNPDPRTRHTYWSILIGGMFMFLVNGFNQATIQRLGSMPTLQKATNVYLLNIPLIFIHELLLVVVGIIIYAYFSHINCDPYSAGMISNQNQIAPYFVLKTLNDIPGIAGLYVATLCCAALSTLSSGNSFSVFIFCVKMT